MLERSDWIGVSVSERFDIKTRPRVENDWIIYSGLITISLDSSLIDTLTTVAVRSRLRRSSDSVVDDSLCRFASGVSELSLRPARLSNRT